MSNNDNWEVNNKQPTFWDGLLILFTMLISALFFQRGKWQ